MDRRLTDEEVTKIEPLVASIKAISQTFTLETAKEESEAVEGKIAG